MHRRHVRLHARPAQPHGRPRRRAADAAVGALPVLRSAASGGRRIGTFRTADLPSAGARSPTAELPTRSAALLVPSSTRPCYTVTSMSLLPRSLTAGRRPRACAALHGGCTSGVAVRRTADSASSARDKAARSTARAPRSPIRSTRSGSPSTTSCTPTSRINYQSLGSGAGIRQLTSRPCSSARRDQPMTRRTAADGARQDAALPDRPRRRRADLQPRRASPQQLKFTGPLLADIFLGKITQWNDPAIAQAQRRA